MSILDAILEKRELLSSAAKLAFENPEIVASAAKLLSSNDASIGGAGGMAGLMDAFQSSDMGDILSSWIGQGENLPIDADQLRSVLGEATLGQFASSAGISQSEAGDTLANILPELINKMTPDGAVPDSNALESGLSALFG